MFTKFNLYLFAATLIVLTACHKSHDGDPTPADAPATWAKVSSLPFNEKFTVLETSGTNLYAASASGIVYTSADNGSTWSAAIVKQGTNITALAVFNNNIYVGTSADGIFISNNNGKTFTAQSSVNSVSSFTVWNDNLYVSSAEGLSADDGVRVLNKTTGNWSPFNSTGLPGNYDFIVTKTIVVNQTLASIRGGNGNFYGYGNASSQWNWKSYLNEYHNFAMQDITYDKGILLVSSGRDVLMSSDFGNAWGYDTVGLKKINTVFLPKQRVLYTVNDKIYVLTNMPAGGTWIQQRDGLAALGTTWANEQEFLKLTGATYDIRLLNNVVFIATDDGIYYKKAS